MLLALPTRSSPGLCLVTKISAFLPVSLSVCLALPPAAGNIVCIVSVNNTGTVRVKNIVLQGPENNCSTISVLAPGQASTPCTVHKAVSQAEFDAREEVVDTTTELSVEVGVTGTANVTDPTAHPVKAPTAATDTTTFSGLQLAVRRNLTATASLSGLSVNVTGACCHGSHKCVFPRLSLKEAS
jgi:hypothetical protein